MKWTLTRTTMTLQRKRLTLLCHLRSGGFHWKLATRFFKLRLPVTYSTAMISQTQRRTVGRGAVRIGVM